MLGAEFAVGLCLGAAIAAWIPVSLPGVGSIHLDGMGWLLSWPIGGVHVLAHEPLMISGGSGCVW